MGRQRPEREKAKREAAEMDPHERRCLESFHDQPAEKHPCPLRRELFGVEQSVCKCCEKCQFECELDV